MRRQLKILGLNNNFFGSYESNQVFFRELLGAFETAGAEVFCATNVSEAREILETYNIDFSIGFSKYLYFINGEPLYEMYRTPNYQWISDNPLKMNLDTSSRLIRYIFIDKEYLLILKEPPNYPCLYLPLGFSENRNLPHCDKKAEILFPGKIRNLGSIWKKISDSPWSKHIKKFLDEYSLDSSYIAALKKFFAQQENLSESSRIEIFRLSNEYLRVKKRLTAIKNLGGRKIYILGDDWQNKELRSANIEFLPPTRYADIASVMNQFHFVLNVDPNYHACIHDRFIRAVSAGTACLSNSNEVMRRWNPYTYDFTEEFSLEKLLYRAERDEEKIYNDQLRHIKIFSWEHSALRIIDNYLTGANVDGYGISDNLLR